jgi:uncharacterized protein (TIGR02118 family)
MKLRIFWAVIGMAAAALAGPPEQLFNGKDLDGWTMTGPGQFVIEDGMMKTTGGMGLLYYNRKPFGNATVKVVYKTGGARDNSGVVIRLPEKPTDPWYGVHNGYEVQIDATGDEWHRSGAIYSLSKSTKAMQKPAGEWNTMEIELKGQTTRIRLNGELVNEFEGSQPVPERKMWYEPVRGPRPDVGYIGLQNHDARSAVYFKEISVVEGGAAAASAGGHPMAESAILIAMYPRPKNASEFDKKFQETLIPALKKMPKLVGLQVSKGPVRALNGGEEPHQVVMLIFANAEDAAMALQSDAARAAVEAGMGWVPETTQIFGFQAKFQ